MALTEEQINIVKSTVPVLKEHGNAITAEFYRCLLGENPSLKNMFNLRNQQTGLQQKALATSVLAYATYIDDIPRLRHAVERIAQKHASLFVEPAQYDVVGHYLMQAIGTVLGDALTPEIAEAWTAAYAQLAEVFVKREGELYAQNGPWRGWRQFRIARKEAESDTVTSYYLEPVDGQPLPTYLPGQYVSIQVPIKQIGLNQSRQYSLSSRPSDGMTYYRISVKREETVASYSAEDLIEGRVPGLVSNILFDQYAVGDVVELSPPQGEFFLDPNNESKANSPLVLIGAGVGTTPLVSILDSVLASKTSSRPITWIQSSRSSSSMCFSKHIRQVCASSPNVRAFVFVHQLAEGDADLLEKFDVSKLNAESDLNVNNPSAEYFICGPEGWMLSVRAKLSELGVSQERMSLELFRTGDLAAQ